MKKRNFKGASMGVWAFSFAVAFQPFGLPLAFGETEKSLPSEWKPLIGQQVTCAQGPRDRSFTIPVTERVVNLGMGMRVKTWTFDGTIPGPVIEVCEGDTVTIQVVNQTDVSHGLDTHAFRIDARQYGPVGPGETLTIRKVVHTPGVFMYHCAAGPVTDDHIKAGLYGAMIVHPRNAKSGPAKEFLVIQSGLYGEPDEEGLVNVSADRVAGNNPFTLMFNGRLEHSPVQVSPGDLIRIYFVNVGPGDSAVHVIGSILDRFHQSGNPMNAVYGVQTESVPPGSGATFEFTIPEAGDFVLVDHNNLRFLPTGFAIPFEARDPIGQMGSAGSRVLSKEPLRLKSPKRRK